MSIPLVVNNTTFDYPVAGDEPGWGEEATAWAEEVTNVLNDVVGPDDILQTGFNLANNTASLMDVSGLLFNTATVRSVEIEYSVYRTTVLTGSIIANSAANPTQITSTAHGLNSGDRVRISGSNSTPSINGEYEVTVIDANNYTIAVNVTVAGTAGTWNIAELAESGRINMIYENAAGRWIFQRDFNGDAQVEFDVTNAGQVQYTSSNLNGASYSGTMRFRARTLNQ